MAKKQVNFKLPEHLIEALDIKAKDENTNRTELVIQGIHHVLGLTEHRIDRYIDSRIEEIENRLDQLEVKVLAIGVDEDIHNNLYKLFKRVDELGKAVGHLSKQDTETNIRQEKVLESAGQPKPLNLTELAKRLKVDLSNLRKSRIKKTPEELAAYTKQRDPEKISWNFDQQSNLFYPLL